MYYYDNEHYELVNPQNVYGQFFPAGTVFRHAQADWWYPFYNDALMPNYKVHYQVIKNNPNYFKRSIFKVPDEQLQKS